MTFSAITDQIFSINDSKIFPTIVEFLNNNMGISSEIINSQQAESSIENIVLFREVILSIYKKELNKILPDAAFWVKGKMKPTTRFTWIISPFEYNIMGSCFFSLALMSDEDLVIGIYVDLKSEKVITGVKNEGSSCDTMNYNVNCHSLKNESSIMVFTIPPTNLEGDITTLLARLKQQYCIYPIYNKVAENIPNHLCDVASGHLDIVVAARFSFHDVAAAICIVEQAGGVVTDIKGCKEGLWHGTSLICSNTKIMDALKYLVPNL